jgi:hypothetical protein
MTDGNLTLLAASIKTVRPSDYAGETLSACEHRINVYFIIQKTTWRRLWYAFNLIEGLRVAK